MHDKMAVVMCQPVVDGKLAVLQCSQTTITELCVSEGFV